MDTERRSTSKMSNNNIQWNIPQAREAMDKFKMQAASEVGINLTNGCNGHLTSREAGSVGGLKRDELQNMNIRAVLLRVTCRLWSTSPLSPYKFTRLPSNKGSRIYVMSYRSRENSSMGSNSAKF